MRPRAALTVVILAVALIFLPSCAMLIGGRPAPRWYGWKQASDLLKPGGGQKATITGHTYEEIWRAACAVAEEHFVIHVRNKTWGVIKAERTTHFWESAAAVGIYINPHEPGADQYVTEVVSIVRELGPHQKWEQKVLRDLHRVLAGEPIR